MKTFSAALMEADLMRWVMKPAHPKLVHLDGLNLSRAWCMRSIAAALPVNDPTRKILSAGCRPTRRRRFGPRRQRGLRR